MTYERVRELCQLIRQIDPYGQIEPYLPALRGLYGGSDNPGEEAAKRLERDQGVLAALHGHWPARSSPTPGPTSSGTPAGWGESRGADPPIPQLRGSVRWPSLFRARTTAQVRSGTLRQPLPALPMSRLHSLVTR